MPVSERGHYISLNAERYKSGNKTGKETLVSDRNKPENKFEKYKTMVENSYKKAFGKVLAIKQDVAKIPLENLLQKKKQILFLLSHASKNVLQTLKQSIGEMERER